jgi:hypothetical protein
MADGSNFVFKRLMCQCGKCNAKISKYHMHYFTWYHKIECGAVYLWLLCLYLAAHHHIPGHCCLSNLCHKNLKAHFLTALQSCNGQLFCPTDEELADRKQTPDKKISCIYTEPAHEHACQEWAPVTFIEMLLVLQ